MPSYAQHILPPARASIPERKSRGRLLPTRQATVDRPEWLSDTTLCTIASSDRTHRRYFSPFGLAMRRQGEIFCSRVIAKLRVLVAIDPVCPVWPSAASSGDEESRGSRQVLGPTCAGKSDAAKGGAAGIFAGACARCNRCRGRRWDRSRKAQKCGTSPKKIPKSVLNIGRASYI